MKLVLIAAAFLGLCFCAEIIVEQPDKRAYVAGFLKTIESIQEAEASQKPLIEFKVPGANPVDTTEVGKPAFKKALEFQNQIVKEGEKARDTAKVAARGNIAKSEPLNLANVLTQSIALAHDQAIYDYISYTMDLLFTPWERYAIYTFVLSMTVFISIMIAVRLFGKGNAGEEFTDKV